MKTPSPSKLDYFGCALFLFVWVIPFSYMGLTGKFFPHSPPILNNLYNCSALFTNSVGSWPQYFIQFQFLPDGPWITYNQQEDFKMRPFGYRNRLNRYFEIFNNRGNKRAHFELALWLKENYRQKNPRAPQPIAVRFLQINRNLKMNGFKKHWENEPIEKFNPEQYYVLYISSYLTPPKS